MVKRYNTRDRMVEGAIVGSLAGGVTGGPGGAIIGGAIGAALGSRSYRDPLPREQRQLADYSLVEDDSMLSVENVKKKLEGVM
ncbi:MAG: hypothetical protein ABEJ98_05590 [Candidatus Nanohaloarchaea archaeon]